MKYDSLSKELTERIEHDRMTGSRPNVGFREQDAVRRSAAHDKPTVWRPAFVRDTDKILHSAYYSRFADKTQVFSFYKNDDISRRALHVQLVSRIARTIGAVLNLNADLIEAIALGHDIGHTPFGHAGEKYLDELCFGATGRHFAHNIHSVRVLDGIYPYNITLQTLNGIAAHNGEIEKSHYAPVPMTTFAELDEALEGCYRDPENNKRLMPCTLEGCVVRICDIISYLGKDRQDKPYISMSSDYFEALSAAKKSNYEEIYLSDAVKRPQDAIIRPMFGRMYEKLVRQVKDGDRESPVFKHHIEPINSSFYHREKPYIEESPDIIVTDYIAAMTDDYFVDLHRWLFPDKDVIKYHGYFE